MLLSITSILFWGEKNSFHCFQQFWDFLIEKSRISSSWRHFLPGVGLCSRGLTWISVCMRMFTGANFRCVRRSDARSFLWQLGRNSLSPHLRITSAHWRRTVLSHMDPDALCQVLSVHVAHLPLSLGLSVLSGLDSDSIKRKISQHLC